MAAGYVWTPRPYGEVVGPLLDLFHGTNIGVKEPDFAAIAPQPYLHITNWVAALIVPRGAHTIFLKKKGHNSHKEEVLSLQTALDRGYRTRIRKNPLPTPFSHPIPTTHVVGSEWNGSAWQAFTAPELAVAMPPDFWDGRGPTAEEAVSYTHLTLPTKA